ncbi:alanine dehydrogenase [Anaerosacchariphilus polymeriproducens]|uniref:Alanine dehydrogenase n=1 Tax=Anaerosacchariphilus polymeriproducens TaxID=1812858 RepID=A0A371AZY4_9FIRM|nr:alanine dehydrogenase [Anaerosacchariphilus polymeriproducens]RDU25109.1 alanine dehydrogenase [Anaerosacchariphilus polymeriproducens]
MIIGVPKEIKNNENRVAITPAGVIDFIAAGHRVYIEKNAGLGSGITDEEYQAAGAVLLDTPKEVFDTAEMIMKVKEPLPEEYDYFKEGQILFTYLHLAPAPELAKALLEKKVVGVAYETIELEDKSLPLLIPMSEVAGRMSTQIGAQFLEKHEGGKGILLGGVPGVESAEVVIIGGGVVGINAAKMAVGLGASVTIIDKDPKRLAYLDDIFGGRLKTLMSNSYNIAKSVSKADLVIGAVLVTGAKAPKLVTEQMVASMSKGSVIVDVAIDQGGSFETIDRFTTHDKPVYIKHGVIHYAVANMPGSVARTSTFALTNVTIDYALQIANKGYKKALLENPALLNGLNLMEGHLTYKAVADGLQLPFMDAVEALSV